MHFTRRLLDRGLPVTLAFVVIPAAGVVASCASDDDDDGARTEEGLDAASLDGSPKDAGSEPAVASDAGVVDASPLPIVCGAGACATALVTTLETDSDRGEGFCALLRDGTVACWGASSSGRLGRGEDAGSGSRPARVDGLVKVVALDHTCALDEDGATWCWGTGPFLRDDAGAVSTERVPVKLPIPPATHVGVGSTAACAAVDGGILCWGENLWGQVGPRPAMPFAGTHPPRQVALPPGAPVRRIAVGYATFVLREDGAMVTWGYNPSLGRVSSLFPDPYPAPMSVPGVSTVDVAGPDVCATAGGTAYCWGAVVPKSTEEPIPYPPIGRALPEPVVVPEPVVQIATTSTTRTLATDRGIIQPYRWCATTLSGAVYCVGFNESGQVGSGNKDYVHEPVRVVALPEPVASVQTTWNTTCALTTSGKVYCWGSNFYGQLGNGKSRGESLVPEEVVLP